MFYLRETVQNFEYIGGEDIWETDFDGRSAEDVAKENAFNSVVAVKLAVENGENIELGENDESRAEIEALALTERNGETQESDFYRNALGVVREKYIYNAVRESIVSGINISSVQIEQFCDENREKYKYDLMDVEAEILYFDEYEEAKDYISGEKVKEKYRERLNLMASEFENMYSSEGRIEEGRLFGPYEEEEGYIVVIIAECTEADEAFVEETMTNTYKESIMSEFFSKEADKWYSSAEIEVNENLWRSISVESLK